MGRHAAHQPLDGRLGAPLALMLWSAVMASGCQSRQPPAAQNQPTISSTQPSNFWVEPFDELDDARWHEVVLHGHTRYRLTTVDGRRCVQAESSGGGASMLVSRVRFNPRTYPWLSWDWRVKHPIEREALNQRAGSDASARVYVYFDTHGLPWQKHNLDYVWSTQLPLDTQLSSPFAATSQIIVAESGRGTLDRWQHASRNLADDYERVFKRTPPDVVAIGLMTDTDSTKGEALAYYTNLRISSAADAALAQPQ